MTHPAVIATEVSSGTLSSNLEIILRQQKMRGSWNGSQALPIAAIGTGYWDGVDNGGNTNAYKAQFKTMGRLLRRF